MHKLFKRFLIGIGAVATLWLSAAGVLIATSAPAFTGKPFLVHTLPAPPCVTTAQVRCFSTRDGKVLHAVWIDAASDDRPVVLLLHGIMSSGEELLPFGTQLHEATGAAVASLDLRGHGASAGTFGDIDYIGQYEDDVADVVAALRREQPTRPVALAGHSMGGGVAMRYAAKKSLPPVDRYLLLAPHLGEESPTTRHDSADAAGIEPPIKLHLRRTIGLLMLNVLGITSFNGLGTLYLNVANESGLLHYSFRAMASCAPDDYRAALAADDKPLLIIAGGRDEAFDAAQYPQVAKLHRNGEALIVADQTHDGILRSPQAIAAAAAWLR